MRSLKVQFAIRFLLGLVPTIALMAAPGCRMLATQAAAKAAKEVINKVRDTTSDSHPPPHDSSRPNA